MTQRAPRYAVHYEDRGLFQQALRNAHGNVDLVDPDDFYREGEASTLPAAKSIKRALERRGHSVHGIFERINIRESWDWHSEEYKTQHFGEMEWEWDEERPVDE
jgi:hypothetical protein